MSPITDLLTRLHSSQSGFTLVELLVAMPLALLLMFAALDFSDLTVRNQQATTNRAQAITQAQVGLERMTREIRDAADFRLLTSQVVEVDTYVRPPAGSPSGYSQNLKLVRYDCTRSQCRRYEGPPGGPLSSASTVLFTDVANADVFNPAPSFVNPNYIAVKVQISILRQRNPITLTDGVVLPNVTNPS